MDKYYKYAYYAFLIIAFATALYYSPACSDGTSYVEDRYAQFDERLAMLEVNSILHPGDAKHFVFYTISGSALFYGRLMMWVDAAVSYIPDKIWGVQGQVIATRLTHFLVLLISIYLLIQLFIKDELLRATVLLFTLLSPYFFYFSLIPKPEPFVLLFLALFLRGYIKASWSFGKHYVWLGFALGCKISVLPLVPLFLLLPIIYKSDRFKFDFALLPLIKSGLWTVLGFLLCIPCLILAPFKPVFLETYIHQALVGAKKDYDDATVNFFSWIHQLVYEHFSVLPFMVVLLLCFVLAFSIYSLLQTKKISKGNLLFGIGLVQLLLIFILTKRIWPHYLFVGIVFTVIASAALFEESFKKYIKWFCVFLALFIGPQFFAFKTEVTYFVNRENQAHYQEVKSSGISAFEYLDSKKVKFIGCDLTAYVPNKLLVETQFYEPFPEQKRAIKLRMESVIDYSELLYTSGYDALVFEKNCPEDSLNKLSKAYFMKNAFTAFSKYVPSKYHFDTAFASTSIYLRNDFSTK